MKISIITVAYNAEKTIEHTILSVLNQSYKNIEYILVDGKSTDNTLLIINKYKHRIATVVSEKDVGIYDAMNKGIKLATGDVIGILNSDDFYTSKTVIEEVIQVFKQTSCDGVYADLNYVDEENINKVKRYWKSRQYKENDFAKGWMPPHPTFFVKKEMYNKFGIFNLALKTAADYELMLRFIHVNKINVTYLPKTIVNMRLGGASNKSIIMRLKANREDKKAWQLNGIQPPVFLRWMKPLKKIKQFYKRN